MVFINIVLYPSEKQKPKEYIKLLSSIMGSHVMIPSSNSSDRSTLLRTFDKIGEYYHGYFCNPIFLKQDSKTLNVMFWKKQWLTQIKGWKRRIWSSGFILNIIDL